MISHFTRLVDGLVSILASIALVSSAGMILLNVFNRYVVLGWLREAGEKSETIAILFEHVDGFLSPLSATADEVPGLLLVWIAFLGAYLAYRSGGHIAFDMMVTSSSDKIQKLIKIVSDTTIIAFLCLLFIQSVRMIQVDGSTEIETAEIAQGWFMLIIPLSSGLMIFALLLDMLGREETE